MADPHRDTLGVYEARAHDWADLRSPTVTEAAAYTRGMSGHPGPFVDLGCGPGWNLGALPEGTIAMDASGAMLDLVAERAPGFPRVQADLRNLPFGRHTLGGAWANRSYVHVDRRLMPISLWDLHRSLRVGARAFISLFAGDQEHGTFPDDDFPGRSFSLWPEALARQVVTGAGFDIEGFEIRGEGRSMWFAITLRRDRTLADTVGPDMDLLLVGLNPSLYAADRGVGFARPGNRAWPALLASGIATVDRDPVALLERGVGMTDLVKRATPQAKELTRAEYVAGLDRLEALCGWLRPRTVCVVGLTGWRAATGDGAARSGWQPRELGSRPVYLMPNPSGANAHVTVDDLARHLRIAAGTSTPLSRSVMP